MVSAVGIDAFCLSSRRHGWRPFGHHDGRRSAGIVLAVAGRGRIRRATEMAA
jgi:hypothetical protein